MNVDSTEYRWDHAECGCAHKYLLPAVASILSEVANGDTPPAIVDLGCGNGSVAARLASRGHRVVGVEPSSQGVEQARNSYPDLDVRQGSAYDDLAGDLGCFPIVLSLEVVEHVYDPHKFAMCVYDLLEPGGTAILSTPFHGYWKNLGLSVTGGWDVHFTALRTHGHIKFWSRRTLTQLLEQAGLVVDRFVLAGRVPSLAKSMIAVARRPSA